MDLRVAILAIKAVAEALGKVMGFAPEVAFWIVYQNITFKRVSSYKNSAGDTFTSGAISKSAHLIEFASLEYEGFSGSWAELRGTNHLIHELGHAFASTSIGRSAYPELINDMQNDPLLRRTPLEVGDSYGFASGYRTYTYQFAVGDAQTGNEIFADMFVGFVTGKWFNGGYEQGSGYGPDQGKNSPLYVQMALAKSTWISGFMYQLLSPNSR